MNNYKQAGERITHTVSGSAISSGDPRAVGTGLLAIALGDAIVGESVEMATEGVYLLPKVSAAVITQGQQVLWDESADAVDDDQATPGTGDFLCGYAWESAGNGVTTIAVKINRGAPTVS